MFTFRQNFKEMKNILLLLLFILLIGCDPKQDEIIETPKGEFNPEAMITIRPANGVALRSQTSGLTALQIVQQTMAITFQSQWFSNNYSEDKRILDRGFNDAQRDYSIPALKMFGSDIITNDGTFMKEFIYGTNLYLITSELDTIAYIPQSVIDSARISIETAFTDSNYVEVYRLFNEAFTFVPIK